VFQVAEVVGQNLFNSTGAFELNKRATKRKLNWKGNINEVGMFGTEHMACRLMTLVEQVQTPDFQRV
jgi:hypothetical protein